MQVDVCRSVKGDHYIRINDSDIFSHNLTYLNPHGQVIPGGAFAVGGQIEVVTGEAYDPIPQEVSKIKTILSSNARLPLWQKLLFDAYDKHFYREYKSAIVEAGTAFEVFVYDFIRKGYVRLGKTELEIENIFKSGFKNLLFDHVRILTGKDFSNSNEYTLLESNSYKMRNQIVHRGAMATDVDSAKAVNTVGDTIKFMLSLNYF